MLTWLVEKIPASLGRVDDCTDILEEIAPKQRAIFLGSGQYQEFRGQSSSLKADGQKIRLEITHRAGTIGQSSGLIPPHSPSAVGAKEVIAQREKLGRPRPMLQFEVKIVMKFDLSNFSTLFYVFRLRYGDLKF